MKRLGYVSAAIGLTALTLWTAILALELAEKIHCLPVYFRASTSESTLTLHTQTTANNALVADESTDSVPVPSDHPPLRIICGAHIFRVVYASHDWMIRKRQPAYAMTEMGQELIVLDRQRDAVQVREDVLHELMHIALWEGGGKMDVLLGEEGYIKPTAPSLRDILVDNPKLVKWLVKAGG